MAVAARSELALPNRSDAIRIAPLAAVHELDVIEPSTKTAAGPPPKLTYRGGPLLASVQLVTVFWGKAWGLAANKATPGKINSFFDAILTSSLMDQLAEYDTGSHHVGHGKRIATATVATPNPKLNVSDGAIQHFLQTQIGNGTVPASGPNVLYFVYLPPGVSVTQGGSRSCQAFCGYHSDISSTVFYAVMPYPTCKGCTGSIAAFDALTATSSHELCEAITDPVPGTGWYDDHHGEIGDICAWTFTTIAGYTVQQEWSNRTGTCS